MTDPLVTIAIPIFNAERYLNDAIRSCINQTYKKWELLLMCDGSTDKSTTIANELSKLDSRIHVIDDCTNRGLVYRLNQSVKLAKGELYARMDADDIMYITRLEEQVKYLQNNPKIDVLGTSIMTIDEDNNIIGSGLYSGRVEEFVHPTVMGKTSWFKANPYSSWAIRAEDTELWLRTNGRSNFWSLDKPLLFYREFGIQNTKKYLLTQKTMFEIYSKYNEYGKSMPWRIKNSVLTISKIVAYKLFSLFGRTDYLVRKRNRLPILSDKCLSKEDLLYSIQ